MLKIILEHFFDKIFHWSTIVWCKLSGQPLSIELSIFTNQLLTPGESCDACLDTMVYGSIINNRGNGNYYRGLDLIKIDNHHVGFVIGTPCTYYCP